MSETPTPVLRSNSLQLDQTCHLSSAITPGNPPLFSPSGIGYALKPSGTPGALPSSSSDVEVFSYRHTISLAACISQVPRWGAPIPILSVPNTLDTTKRSIQNHWALSMDPRLPRFARRSPAFPRTLHQRGRNIWIFIGFSRLLSLNQTRVILNKLADR